jgi:hypothetical protein
MVAAAAVLVGAVATITMTQTISEIFMSASISWKRVSISG